MSKFDFLKKLGILGSITCLLSGCSFNPSVNVEPDVYGPPPIEDQELNTQPEDSQSENNITEDIDSENIEEFDYEQNEALCIYGPPEMLEGDYAPEENIENEVYGPPAKDLMDD